jgi:hypothetical protein
MRPQFTPDEEFVIAYYRQADKSSHSRLVIGDIITVTIAVVLLVVGMNSPDFTWALVGFALVSWRLLRNVFSGPRFHDATGSTIRKYEAALAEQLTLQNTGETTPPDTTGTP